MKLKIHRFVKKSMKFNYSRKKESSNIALICRHEILRTFALMLFHRQISYIQRKQELFQMHSPVFRFLSRRY